VQNKRRLFIIGASSFGREVESWLNLIPLRQRDWELIGYLDKDKSVLSRQKSDYKILGDENNFNFKEDDYVIIAISEPKIKDRIYKKIKNVVDFYTFIAPNVILGKFVRIGQGVIVCPNSLIATNVKIGNCVTINNGTQIGHDVIINDYTSIMSQVEIGGNCNIGKKVYIGSNSTIIPDKKVGDNALIGTGSVVIRNVKENTTVFGNPAKKI